MIHMGTMLCIEYNTYTTTYSDTNCAILITKTCSEKQERCMHVSAHQIFTNKAEENALLYKLSIGDCEMIDMGTMLCIEYNTYSAT